MDVHPESPPQGSRLRPFAHELREAARGRGITKPLQLLEALDGLGWSHDEHYLRDVWNGKALPDLGYVSELAAALGATHPLQISELCYWIGALFEEKEIIPARFLAAGETTGIARIRRDRKGAQMDRKDLPGQSDRSDGGGSGSAGEEGFEPSIA